MWWCCFLYANRHSPCCHHHHHHHIVIITCEWCWDKEHFYAAWHAPSTTTNTFYFLLFIMWIFLSFSSQRIECILLFVSQERCCCVEQIVIKYQRWKSWSDETNGERMTNTEWTKERYIHVPNQFIQKIVTKQSHMRWNPFRGVWIGSIQVQFIYWMHLFNRKIVIEKHFLWRYSVE